MYYILSEIGHQYKNEKGAINTQRAEFLEGREKRLKFLIKTAKALQEEQRRGPIAPQLPQGPGRVKALIDFYEQKPGGKLKITDATKWSEIQRIKNLDLLNAEIIRLRQWIVRQGAILTPEGDVNWLNSRAVVHYDDVQAQPKTRVDFQAGLLWLQGKPLDTKFMATAFSGPGYAIYVMSRDGHIHLSPHVIGGRHHSSLLAGATVAGAGEMQVEAGRLVWLSNKSGHYCPDIHQLLQTLHALQQGGVPFAFRMKVFGVAPNPIDYLNVDAFMLDNLFDNDTLEMDQLCFAYGEYLTPQFFLQNQIALLSATSAWRAGFYDMSTDVPRRIPSAEFEHKMQAAGMNPVAQAKSGAGR